MLKLTDILKISQIDLNFNDYKIHLASTGIEQSPLDAYYNGEFKKWQEWQSRDNFTKKYIVSLIEFKQDRWLFVGAYKVLDHRKISDGNHEYKTELLEQQDDLVGRLVVSHVRAGRQSCINGVPDDNRFCVAEILEKKRSIKEFPGYNLVSINSDTLKIIIKHNYESWRVALTNFRGVYLISDKLTGKLYVGSATSNTGGIWQRWSDYAKDGHGGNVDLKRLMKEKGEEYQKNFIYSILEISALSDEEILKRESYWKEILLTREFGYNLN